MKQNSFFLKLPILLLTTIILLNACSREDVTKTEPTPSNSASDRASIFYGVTATDGFSPAGRVIGVDNATGNIVSNVGAFYVDNAGNTIQLENLKGICLTSWGQYFITTGDPVNSSGGPSFYSNALFKINPVTGQCSYASTNQVSGTVSDLEHDPNTLSFYGLSDNGNAIIEISDNNNNYGDYSAAMPIFGIEDNYTLKGLSLVTDASGTYYVGCASTPEHGNPAKLYMIPQTGGFATFMTDLDPVGGWVNGHCALGFDQEYNRMHINRDAAIVTLGINFFKWNPPFGLSETTFFWSGGEEFDYEDLTSSVY